ncbi:MAG TPA: MbcA/ParS/Xre antitoxin family protein [Terriglobales bacterium]|nr:MbcA/ParS/Xre antitoxin family protein [Terriglobales bacterium]
MSWKPSAMKERLSNGCARRTGERPLDQLDTDMGTRTVEDVLGRIAYGVYS